MKINLKKIIKNKVFIFILIGLVLVFLVFPNVFSFAAGKYRETILNLQDDVRYVTIKGEVSFNKDTGEIEDTLKLSDFDYEYFINPLSIVDNSNLFIEYKDINSLVWKKSSCEIDVKGLRTDNFANFECKNVPMKIGEYLVRMSGSADIDYSIFRKAVKDVNVYSKEYTMSIKGDSVVFNNDEYQIGSVNYQSGFNIGIPIYNNELKYGKIKDVKLNVNYNNVVITGVLIPNVNSKFMLEASYSEKKFWNTLSFLSSTKSVCDNDKRFPSIIIDSLKGNEIKFELVMEKPLVSGDGFIYIYTAEGCGSSTHDFVKIPFDYVGE